MFMLITIFLAVLGLWVWPEGIGDVPMSELTLKMLARALFALALAWAVFVTFRESLEHDLLWPWRWTWWYVAGMVVKFGALAVAGYYGLPLLDLIPADKGWVVWVILLFLIPNLLGWLLVPMHDILRDMFKPEPTIAEMRKAAGYED